MTPILSYGQHRADVSPYRFGHTFEQLAEWLRTDSRFAPRHGEKDSPYLVFADFGENGTRDYKHLVASYGVPLDLDLGKYAWDAESIRVRLAGYNFIAWTSYSHTPDRPRWRVVVALERGATKLEHYATWERLAELFLHDCGESSKDATRLNYLPGPCLHPEHAQLIRGDGVGFPVSTVPEGTVAPADDDLRDGPVEGWMGPTDDEELIAHMCASRARASDAFAKAGTPTKFEALWTGDVEELSRLYPSTENHQPWNYTAADAALANDLAYYTGGDGVRCVRLMETSALAQRDSWRQDKAERAVLLACRGRVDYAFMRAPAPVAAEVTLAAGALAVPQANHLTTDQANAQRLQQHFGNNLIACAGEFFAWDGKRWKRDDGLAQRFACELSRIVRAEADVMRAEAAKAEASITPQDVAANLANPRKHALRGTETGSKAFDLAEMAKALDAWSRKCEMKATQDAALGLLKKLLRVEASALDANPWLLNVANGTVDLRTGVLKDHDPADFMTKLAPVAFDPAARAPRFAEFLREIFNDDAALVAFLSRWFGYAGTGSTREQKLVIHWGTGSNGKSTLLELVEAVLGDYSTAAPPGLVASKENDSAQASEVAELHGRRLVTASESEEGARMREAFIKLSTGGDKLKGRRPYGQWFEFAPTHKLQLLTNYKPQIRGSDFAIWRRILLVPYTQSYGSAEDIAAGKAKLPGDAKLKEVLAGEQPGVLAWIVDGARRWYAEGGLRPPDTVIAAGAKYQSEQDRVGEYVRDLCRLDVNAWTPVATMYSTYQAWCRDSGVHPLGRGRFTDELERVVPSFRRERRHAGHGVAGVALANAFGVPSPSVA